MEASVQFHFFVRWVCCPLEHAERSQGFLDVLHDTGRYHTLKGTHCMALAREAVSACDSAAPAQHIFRYGVEVFSQRGYSVLQTKSPPQMLLFYQVFLGTGGRLFESQTSTGGSSSHRDLSVAYLLD
jgi:hypothetical protein